MSYGAVRALWSGRPSYAGQRLRFDGVLPAPHAPGQGAPPLVLAGHGPAGLRLVVEAGDGWTAYGGPGVVGLDREDSWRLLAGQSAALAAECERQGRDPATLTRSVLVGYADYRPLESAASFADEVGRAEAIGFDEVCFYWPFGPPGSRFWADQEVVADAISAVVPTT